MIKKTNILIGLFLILTTYIVAQPLAFPTAEGFGKFTKGGRGGHVYEVTNLQDSGNGSLRQAIEAEGSRTVVFRISGIIELQSALIISNPYITIAGQTAPGDGICIKNHPIIIEADQVIIRYIRLRLGDASGEATDALSSRYHKNLIIDHVSTSWSVDETMSIYHCDSVTVQWCIISESLYHSNHSKGNHGYGAIWGSDHSSYHHNLLAHHSSRNPRFASGSQRTDYRNNVIYNWGFNSAYGGEKVEKHAPGRFNFTEINMVANYYKPGPATAPGPMQYRIANPSSRQQEADYGLWYIEDNYIEGHDEVSKDNWDGGVQLKDDDSFLKVIKSKEAFEWTIPIEQHSAQEAFTIVLQHAGATLPKRDRIDVRIVQETI